MNAALIGLDWGTTSLRAFLMSDKGDILDETHSNQGIMQVKREDLPNVFETIVAPWRKTSPILPALACGMIGSSQSWREAPYCACPAGASELANNLIRLDDYYLSIIPGVDCDNPIANVMRGEETQIIGALSQQPELSDDALFLLPGTHSKWVPVKKGRIEAFQTFMTGEIYALLSQYSILGRPAQQSSDQVEQTERDRAFLDGVSRAFEAKFGAGQLLFTVRSRVLNGEISPAASLDYLSGLLIGDEIRTAQHSYGSPSAIIANQSLGNRYQQALSLIGCENVPIINTASQQGIFSIAQQSHLLSGKI